MEPTRSIRLEVEPRRPRLRLVGPVILDDVAIVGGSQLGWQGVAWRDGTVRFRLPAGARPSPPIVLGDRVLLVDDCVQTPGVAATERVLGCARRVDADGEVRGAETIVGERGVIDAFANARGAERLRVDGETSRWTRGDVAVQFGATGGRAAPTPTAPDEVLAIWRGRTWAIGLDGEALVARGTAGGAEPWRIDAPTAAVLGVIPAAGIEAPMVRVARQGGPAGPGMIGVLDVDATGSRHAQATFPVPGISILAHAMAADGTTALALRLDATLTRDHVVCFDRRGALLWSWALPQIERPDPVGLAVTPEAVLVFHDGDRLTVLPTGD